MRIILDIANIVIGCAIIALILFEPKHISVTVIQPVEPTVTEQVSELGNAAANHFRAGMNRLALALNR